MYTNWNSNIELSEIQIPRYFVYVWYAKVDKLLNLIKAAPPSFSGDKSKI